MSTIAADNAKPSAGGTSTGLIDGLAKVWAVAESIGTAALEDDTNVSSITDNATGDISFTLTNAFSAATFSRGGVAGRSTYDTTFHTQARSSQTAGGYRTQTYDYAGAQDLDVDDLCVQAWGDLA